MSDPRVSTGRGGAGNIGKDDMSYTDAGIVREGIEGVTADGEYSSGRGGAGNIGTGLETPPPQHTKHDHRHEGIRHRTDDEVVPEPSLRTDVYPEYHTGRGGQGNVHKDKFGGHSSAREERDARRGSGPDGNVGRSGSPFGEKLKHVLNLGKGGGRE